MNCAFCTLSRQNDSGIVKETKNFWVKLDKYPLALGHCLVIPKKHFSNIMQMPESLRHEAIDECAEVERALMQAIKPDGLQIRQNYQPFIPDDEFKLDHVHFHIIPRYKDDAGYRKSLPRTNPTEKQTKETQQKLEKALAKTQTKLI